MEYCTYLLNNVHREPVVFTSGPLIIRTASRIGHTVFTVTAA